MTGEKNRSGDVITEPALKAHVPAQAQVNNTPRGYCDTIENKLLARMTTPADMALVLQSGLSAEAFEDLICRTAFDFMLNFWHKRGDVPTRQVMAYEFPTLRLPQEVEEQADWIVEKLQNRRVVNGVNDVVLRVAKRLHDDPHAVLAELITDLTDVQHQAGRIGTTDGLPRLWRVADLAPGAQPRWLAKNRLPRAAVSLLVGDEGIGKSLFWVYLAAAVTTGKPLIEFGVASREPAHVIVVVTEDDWSTTVRPRLEVAGADLDMVRVICAETDGSGAPEFPRDLHVITGADPAPALVVVDAWLDTVPHKIDVKNPQQARQALHPWKDLATTTDAAVLLLSHTNRVNSPNAREKYGVTGELRKKARMALFAQRDDDGHLVIGPDKANAAASVAASRFEIKPVNHFAATDDHDGTVPLLVYVGESDRTSQEHIAQSYATGHGSGVRDEIVAWLVGLLANRPRWQSDIVRDAQGAGFSVDQLKRHKRLAGVESVRDGQTNAWFWRLSGQEGRPADDQGSDGGFHMNAPLHSYALATGLPAPLPSTEHSKKARYQ